MADDPKRSLNVLPSGLTSNKINELRDMPAAASSEKKLNEETPVDWALDSSLTPAQKKLKEKIIDALRTVYDPELPVNLFDLGLIYKLTLQDGQKGGQIVDIEMTLTTPNCPVAEEIPDQVQEAVAGVEGVERVNAELVWTPRWGKEKMSEAALLELGLL